MTHIIHNLTDDNLNALDCDSRQLSHLGFVKDLVLFVPPPLAAEWSLL